MVQQYFNQQNAYNLSLLIVDDSNTARQMMHSILSEHFEHVDFAENGKEALELFEQKKHDIIITDIVMPVMSGTELVTAIRAKGYITPIMAISGASGKEHFVELINAGVTAFVIKPINIDFLYQQLYRLCKPLTDAKRDRKLLDNYSSLVDKNVISSTTDLDGNIIQVSQAFCNISKYTKEELIGQNHRIVKHPDMLNETYENLWQTICADNVWHGEIKNLAKDGSTYWADATISPIHDDSGAKIGYTAIRQNITDKKKIEEMSITDSMTGLFNRRYFNEVMSKQLGIAKRYDKYFGFLMLDVDHFKQYNDTYGHLMGDDVLIKLGNTMKDVFKRGHDICFRLGGEEFGVIFVGTEPTNALLVTNRLKNAIEELRIEHSSSNTGKYVTVSMGLVVKKGPQISSADTIYKEADKLLYEAKQSGRNRVCTE